MQTKIITPHTHWNSQFQAKNKKEEITKVQSAKKMIIFRNWKFQVY